MLALSFFIFALSSGALAAVAGASHLHERAVTEIPSDSLNNLDEYWNYYYPWGQTHNGGAKMTKEQVSVKDGVLTLTADPTSGESGPIHYYSGAIHAKKTFTVAKGGGYDFSAEFIAPVARGTWPAFWLNAASGWPPEIDVAEWKGSGKISFNTFNTSSQVDAHDVDYPNPSSWHSVKAEIRDVNGWEVSTKFYLDGTLVTTQVANDYVGKGLRLCVNLSLSSSHLSSFS